MKLMKKNIFTEHGGSFLTLGNSISLCNILVASHWPSSANSWLVVVHLSTLNMITSVYRNESLQMEKTADAY